jgi:hypothetical protein
VHDLVSLRCLSLLAFKSLKSRMPSVSMSLEKVLVTTTRKEGTFRPSSPPPPGAVPVRRGGGAGEEGGHCPLDSKLHAWRHTTFLFLFIAIQEISFHSQGESCGKSELPALGQPTPGASGTWVYPPVGEGGARKGGGSTSLNQLNPAIRKSGGWVGSSG